MQRYTYSNAKLNARDIPERPQGARPNPRKRIQVTVQVDDHHTSNVASLMQNAPPSPQLRALPPVPSIPPVPPIPPGLNSAYAHRMLGPSRTTRGIRPLPCCPLSNSQPFSSSSTRSTALSIGQPSAGVHSLPVAITLPVVLPLPLKRSSLSPPPVPPKDYPVEIVFRVRKYDDSAFDTESIESKCPSIHLDSECDVAVLENAEPHQPKGYKRVTDFRWILGKRTVPQQPTTQNFPTAKKWVKEKKGQRATIKNYDKILMELRTL